MFDTNVFNRVLDGILPFEALGRDTVVYATHVQRDELNNTKNEDRRRALAQVFSHLISENVPTSSSVVGVSRIGESCIGGDRVVATESTVWGVSRWGFSKWSAEDDLYSAVKRGLDALNGAKPNNVHDALIAETSLKRGLTLVTDDTDLAAVTRDYGGDCISVAELLRRCGDTTAT